MPCGTDKRADVRLVMFFEKSAEAVARRRRAGHLRRHRHPGALGDSDQHAGLVHDQRRGDAAPEGGASK